MKTVQQILDEAYDIQELSMSGMGWKLARAIAPSTAGRAMRKRIDNANATVRARKAYHDYMLSRDPRYRGDTKKAVRANLKTDADAQKARSKRDELMGIMKSTKGRKANLVDKAIDKLSGRRSKS